MDIFLLPISLTNIFQNYHELMSLIGKSEFSQNLPSYTTSQNENQVEKS